MSKNKIKGITIEIGGDTKPLEKALGDVNAKSRDLQKELKQVDRMLKLDSGNVTLAAQKTELLEEAVKNAADELDALKKAEQAVNREFANGKITSEQYREFNRDIVRAEQNLRNLREQAQRTDDAIDTLGDKMARAGNKIEKSGGKISAAGGKLSKVSTVSVAAVGATATDAASLEKAANKSAAATDSALGSAENYENLIKNIYDENYGESYEDIADKIALVGQQMDELDETGIDEAVKRGYTLQDAFDIDFNEGLRGANALVKQFGVTSEQAYDLIVQGVQKGLNQNGDLADQVSEYSVYFADMGYEADEMFNILASGAEKGIFQIDYLNDAMKELPIRTIAGDAEKALTSLGFNAKTVQRKIADGGREGAKQITEIIRALANVDNKVLQNQYGVEIFGTKWEDSGRDACLALADVNGAISLNSKKMEQLNDIMYSGTADQMQTAMREIRLAGTEIGKSVLPTLAEIAKAIAGTAKSFSQLPDSVKKGVMSLLLMLAVIAPLLSGIGKAVTGIGKLVKVFGTGGKGVAVLAKAFGGLKTAWAGIASFAKAAGAVILGALTGPVIAVAAVAAAISAIAISMSLCHRQWHDFFVMIGDGIKNIGTSIADFLTGYFKTWSDFLEVLGEKWKSAWETISGFLALMCELIVIVVQQVINAVINAVHSINNCWESIKSTAAGVVHSVINYFASLPSRLYNIGANMIEGFKNGITARLAALKKSVQDTVNSIKSIFTNKKGFDVHSPSKWSYSIGGYVGDGFKNGLKDSINKMRTVISSVKTQLSPQSFNTHSTVTHNYTGTITVKGVNNKNEAVYSTQAVMRDIADELARERRRK